MTKPIIHSRHVLPYVEDESYQTFGDLQFYPNGIVKLGPTSFAYGAPIHRHRFGANLVAWRNIDEPHILEIETPVGTRLRFLYRPFFRTWYQLVAIDDPRLYLHQERYGTEIAIGLFYVRWAARWAIITTLQTLLCLFVFGLVFFIISLL